MAEKHFLGRLLPSIARFSPHGEVTDDLVAAEELEMSYHFETEDSVVKDMALRAGLENAPHWETVYRTSAGSQYFELPSGVTL
jgi:hypothetical protein